MNKSVVTGIFSALLLLTVSAFAQPKAFTETEVLAESAKYDMGCNDPASKAVEAITNSYRFDYESSTTPDHIANFYIVSCGAGAYNSSSILLLSTEVYTETGSESTLVPISFVVPRLNRQNKVAGFSGEIVTGDLSYDPTTKMFSTFSKGRGIGDMYVTGTYQLFETQVVLRKYFVDNKEGPKELPGVVYEDKEPLN